METQERLSSTASDATIRCTSMSARPRWRFRRTGGEASQQPPEESEPWLRYRRVQFGVDGVGVTMCARAQKGAPRSPNGLGAGVAVGISSLRHDRAACCNARDADLAENVLSGVGSNAPCRVRSVTRGRDAAHDERLQASVDDVRQRVIYTGTSTSSRSAANRCRGVAEQRWRPPAGPAEPWSNEAEVRPSDR